MTETRPSLSALGEAEEQSTIGMNNELNLTTGDELEPIDELEDPTPSVKISANKFRMLCDNVQNSFSEIDNSMFDLLELKDNLLLQFLPANVSTQITLVISRLYRAYSLSQIPVNELVRLAQLYSQPFDMKSIALKKLYENNETKKRMLNIALQKLTSMQNNNKSHQQLRCLHNWEKMYIRLALPRSNVRKWKFRLKAFRETAQHGYEHVIDWISTNGLRPTSAAELLPRDEAPEDEEELDEADRIETSGDIGDVLEVDEQQQQEQLQQQRIDQGSDFGDEIESDNDGSFLSSAGKQRLKKPAGSADAKEIKQTQALPTVVTKVDVDIQAKPDFDDQQTSTGDMLATKSLILRVYRPVGVLKSKFQCSIHAHGRKYTTSVFVFDKSSTSKDDSTKTKGRLAAANRAGKAVDPKTKKRPGADSTSPDDIDINTIDKQQCDEILIPMPSVLKRRSLFETDVDPDAIQIEVLGDEKSCGALVLSPEDLRMLDLPNLHSPTSAPLITIDDSITNVTKVEPKINELDLDRPSSELYKSWIARTPQTFTVYNEKRDPTAKLPLHMFWYNQVEITHATKCTMTPPMEVRVPSPKITYVPQIVPTVETHEKGISPVFVPPPAMADDGTDPALSHLNNADDHVEMVKSVYEDKIVRLHESYQAEILRLTKLLSEIPSRHSSQMAELSELDENIRDIVGDDLPPSSTRRPVRQHQQKHEVAVEHQPPPIYGKDLPKNFLDRYQMFLERSVAHRNQLTSKIEQETKRATERQLEIQHRLHKAEQSEERYDDLCLPAVFMPFRSGNVFNPRAYRFFHHVGATDPRLTQTPSIFKLPALPSGSVSVLNLFELSRCYEAANDKENSPDKSTGQLSRPTQPPAPPTTQTSD